MKKTIKILTLAINLLFLNVACAQTTMRSISDAKQIEVNQNQFIGKPLSYLLEHIKVDIKSIFPIPNKKKSEINRITFRFADIDTLRKTRFTNNKPTQIIVVFNQNWNLKGKKCNPYKSIKCREWTKDDEVKFGDLIVYRITVIGEN